MYACSCACSVATNTTTEQSHDLWPTNTPQNNHSTKLPSQVDNTPLFHMCVCVCVCAHTGHACHQSPDQLDPHVQDSSMQASPHHQHSYQGVYGMPPTAQHNPKVVIQSIISLTITQAARRLQSTHAQLTSACSKE